MSKDIFPMTVKNQEEQQYHILGLENSLSDPRI